MFNKDTILSCGASLVGFKEDSNSIYATLSTALKASNSGLWVNALPSVNFEIIAATLSNDAISAATYLTNVYNDSLLSIVNQFVNKSKQNYNSKELLSKTSITSGAASMGNRVVQNGRFVGYWFRPHKSNYMKTQITHLGMQATALQDEDLKIFLYETSQLEPIAVFDYTITKKFSLVWEAVSTFMLKYESDTGGTGQNYLLGYYEHDANNPQDYQLQSQAIYMDFDCGCGNSPKGIYGKYVGIQPIAIPNSYLLYDTDTSTYFIPQVDDVSDFVQSQTYGLTAKINVTCDITDVLCQNISIFAPSLQHAIASRILYDNYASTVINSVADSKREQVKQFAVKYDAILNGYTNEQGKFIKGLIDTLTVDFSALDNYCLPCHEGIMVGNLVR